MLTQARSNHTQDRCPRWPGFPKGCFRRWGMLGQQFRSRCASGPSALGVNPDVAPAGPFPARKIGRELERRGVSHGRSSRAGAPPRSPRPGPGWRGAGNPPGAVRGAGTVAVPGAGSGSAAEPWDHSPGTARHQRFPRWGAEESVLSSPSKFFSCCFFWCAYLRPSPTFG
jgi:hypothetical protein